MRPLGKPLLYAELVQHVKEVVNAPSTRQNPRDEFSCDCHICQRGRYTGKTLPMSRFMQEPKKKKGRPAKTPPEDLTPVKRCPKCHQIVGPGIPHPCTRTSRLETIKNDIVSPISTMQIANEAISSQLKVAKEKGQELVATLTSKHGIPLKVKAANAKEESLFVTKEFVTNFRIQLGLSKRKTLKAMRLFKEKLGGKLEPGMQEYIFDANTCLADFFEIRREEFLGYEDEYDDSLPESARKRCLTTVTRDVIYCVDVEGLIFFLKVARVLDDDSIVKIG